MASTRPKLGIPTSELLRARSVLMPPWTILANRDVVRGAGRFIKAASSFMAYAGTYEVRDDTVVHSVEVGSHRLLTPLAFLSDRACWKEVCG